MGMTIGEAAVRTQCTPATIRYYEEIGLLRPVGRCANGRRAYAQPDIHRLRFIRRCRDLSFAIDDIRALLDVMDGQAVSCLSARDLTLGHLETARAAPNWRRLSERWRRWPHPAPTHASRGPPLNAR